MHEYPPEVEKRIRAECKRFNEALPARIENKASLFLGLALFLNAWFDLDTERRRSKLEPITRRMCFAYAEDYGLDEEQRDDLWYYIARMDQEFLAWFEKKQPKKRGDNGPDAERPG